MPLQNVSTATCGLFVLGFVAFRAIRNIWFHALSGYPGPWLWAATKLPYNWHTLRGTAVTRFRELHDKYGDVIRYEPNGLAFTSPESWDEIYGPYKGTTPMEMDPAIFGGAVTVTGALQITNAVYEEHRRLRMHFVRGLSAKAIASQEYILQNYARLFIAGIRKELKTSSDRVNIAKWFSIATFDIIGDIAFGKSFGGLEEGKVHHWVLVVFSAFKALPLLRVIREIPGVSRIGNFALHFLPRLLKQKYMDHFEYAFALVEKRMQNPKERPDMLYYLMDDVGKGLTRDEIKENAAQLVMAGSEPTATFMAGVCYFLAKNHAVRKKLKAELRSRFSDSAEMTVAQLAQVEYLKLVVREGLRVFPPAADIFPRITPAGGKVIFGKHLPEGIRVSVSAFAAAYSEANFEDPDEFIPERWLPENVATHPNMKASQPFGQGHRSCLGKGLATAEIHLLLANLIWHFDMAVVPEDENWLDDCRVFLGWEKIPLRVQLKPVTSGPRD
ncbi:MAG: hypothetical protein Q9160_004799 [Pyrenula sp. 1 TL-2023]